MSLVNLRDKTFEIYLPEEDVLKSVKRLAVQLNQDYQDKKPLLLSVLNGAFMFTADLMKELDFECEVSFIKMASYSGMKSTGKVRQLIGLDNDINEREIIIVEDIVDTGNTLEKLLETVNKHNPAEVKVCTLLYKPDAYKKDHTLDYVGLEIPNDFIVGYGLDYDGLGRNLKNIYKLK